jgi:hypothetical protein
MVTTTAGVRFARGRAGGWPGGGGAAGVVGVVGGGWYPSVT